MNRDGYQTQAGELLLIGIAGSKEHWLKIPGQQTLSSLNLIPVEDQFFRDYDSNYPITVVPESFSGEGNFPGTVFNWDADDMILTIPDFNTTLNTTTGATNMHRLNFEIEDAAGSR